MSEPLNNSETGANNSSKDYFLPVSILIAGFMVSASIMYLVGNKNSVPGAGTGNQNQLAGTQAVDNSKALEVSSRDVVLGDINAPVTIIEYGDYQCPFCGKFFTENEMPLRDEYIKTNKVRMIFRNFQFLGPESIAAASAAECAKDQKQFWAYHDSLYITEISDGKENNNNLTRALLVRLASDLKLDMPSFTNCVDSGKYTAHIDQDYLSAQALGINSTPTTFINGQKITGAVPYGELKTAIDPTLIVAEKARVQR